MSQPSIVVDTTPVVGERFEFGRNWERYLKSIDEARILKAQNSLKRMLIIENLHEKTFLDVGCGSGLFSLAARRLGARVFSFDYDMQSVACTVQLKNKFSPGDSNWQIEQGSVLDQSFLSKCGTFDVVYAWGSLHHTGDMWEALENAAPLVGKGGKLFVAIYNDQGLKSDIWRFIKRTYNRAPKYLRFLITWPIGLLILGGMTFVDLFRFRKPRIASPDLSPRGMAFWTDIVDWVGGYPFEVASADEIIKFYEHRGFSLVKLAGCGRKLGCNEFVFTSREDVGPRPG